MTRRIAVAIVGMVIATLVLSATATFVVARVSERKQAERSLRVQAEGVVELLPDLERAATPRRTPNNPTPDPNSTANLTRRRVIERLQRTLSLSGVAEVRIDAAGNLIDTDLPSPLIASDLPIAQLQAGGSVSGHRGGRLYAAAGRQLNDGSTIVAVTTAAQGALFGPTLRWFALCSVVAVLIGSLVSVKLARRLGDPVHAAVATTRRLAAGDLDARLPEPQTPDSDDELDILARSINSMADSLARSRAQERQFLMSVSHDLRTPLTSIRGYAEAIADGASPDPGAAAGIIIAESKRLERLVGDLLSLARLDVDRFPLRAQPVDLGAALDAAAGSIGPELAAGSVRLDCRPAPGLVIVADPDRLSQVIANLLTNAAGYARSTVWLHAGLEGADAVITVADDGAGSPGEDLPHVFERLYQGDNQDGRRRPGSGLGLAIVSELTTAMGGRVDVRSELGVGTTFSVRFPATSPSEPEVPQPLS